MSTFWNKVVAMRESGRQLIKQKSNESTPVEPVKPNNSKKKKASAKLKVETEIKLDTDNFDTSEMVVVANDGGTDTTS